MPNRKSIPLKTKLMLPLPTMSPFQTDVAHIADWLRKIEIAHRGHVGGKVMYYFLSSNLIGRIPGRPWKDGIESFGQQ